MTPISKSEQPKCTSCYGKKYYTQLDPGGIRKHECPRCKGTGKEGATMSKKEIQAIRRAEKLGVKPPYAVDKEGNIFPQSSREEPK